MALLSGLWCEVAEPANLDECRLLLTARPAERETASCLYQVAKTEAGSGPATRTLKQVASERRDLPWFVFYFGNLNWSDSAVAEDLFGQATEGFVLTGDERGEMLARVSRSQHLSWLGRKSDLQTEVDRIFAIAEVSKKQDVRAWGQLVLARQLIATGDDLSRAYELLRSMQIPVSMENEFSVRKERLVLLGNACLAIGRIAEGRAAYRELVELAVAKSDRYAEAIGRYNLAMVVYEELREAPNPTVHAEAVALATKALEVSSDAGHVSGEVLSAWMLGMLAPGEEGRRHLEHCYQVAEEADLRSHCLNPLATRIAALDPRAAKETIRRSRELAQQSGDGWAELRVWQEGMRVDWLTDSPIQALAASWPALDAIERLRDRQARGSSMQAGFFSVWSDDYAWLLGRIMEEVGGSLETEWAIGEAFRVGERMRARALIDWLRRTGPDARVEAAAEFSTLAEVRSSLEPREALLSFQVAPWEDILGDFAGGSWLLAVTRDAVSVHRLLGRVEIRRAVGLFEGLIERRDGAEAATAALLYQKLLAPALAGLPPEVDRLILVPDDALHGLPFAALRASADAEPVGARYELVQVPSATLWLDWRRAQVSAPGRPLLVLADPELPVADPAADPVGVKVAQVRDAAGALGRLPHARREGRAAVKALGDGLLLMGGEASEARLGSLPLRDFGLVHFAAHAVTDEDRPERSAVLLAAGGEHDGLLQSAEIAGLDLAGRTIVLASCRSASGSVLRGEGVMSLGRAFFQAGAHGVVASLWPLRDDESAALFGRFYRRLAEGATVGEALQGARQEAIAAGEPAAAWAGLVVLGDGSLVPVPGGRRAGISATWWWVVLLIVVVGAVAGWVAIRRFRAFRLVRVPGGGVRAGIDLDRPREQDVDEDESTWSRRE